MGPLGMESASKGTTSSMPRAANFQMVLAAETSSVRNTPLPEVTHTRLVSNGSNSTEPAQCTALPWIHSVPLGSTLKSVRLLLA